MAKKRPRSIADPVFVSESQLVTEALASLAAYEAAEMPLPAESVREEVVAVGESLTVVDDSVVEPINLNTGGSVSASLGGDQTRAEIGRDATRATTGDGRLTAAKVEDIVDQHVTKRALQWGIGFVVIAAGLLGWLILWTTGRLDGITQRLDAIRPELNQTLKDHRDDMRRDLDQLGNKFDRLDDRMRNLEMRRSR